MISGVIVSSVLKTALHARAERQLHYDAGCRLIIPAGQCSEHCNGIPVGLIYYCIIYKPGLAPYPVEAGSNLLMAETSARSTVESGPDRWLIGRLIDYDSCVFLLCFGLPAPLWRLAAHLLTLELDVRVKLLCIWSGRRLATHISVGWCAALMLTC